MATEKITVDIGGTEHIIFRDEILNSGDVTLKTTLLLREQTEADIQEMELKLLQLKHARSSMDNTLQQTAVRYLANKQGVNMGNTEEPDDE